MREHILSEIKRLAGESGGKAPGTATFTKATGITTGQWLGVHWVKWGDALAEAGLAPNALQKRHDSDEILRHIAALCRTLGRLPTRAEIRIRRRTDPEFPSHSTVDNHFRTNADLIAALNTLAKTSGFGDIAALLPETGGAPKQASPKMHSEGWVYMLKSGQHYKIGRSDQIETRLKKITIALPEATVLIHAIQTDDPPGIEAYWHRRFADRRANGEWFKLSGDEVKAFKRRKFQ